MKKPRGKTTLPGSTRIVYPQVRANPPLNSLIRIHLEPLKTTSLPHPPGSPSRKAILRLTFTIDSGDTHWRNYEADRWLARGKGEEEEEEEEVSQRSKGDA
ncbi:hypothetical protein K0M31_015752 [Melipona bicolor]|uniref:Uncharacterized protein n=1 Tax=Melipona bicolor TaxID=60889 RepID=A0AA40FF44_9HYME|nr:hypothetical protein K0M31_015752 [Melipona bicolor]